MDPARIGQCHIGHFRIGNYRPDEWENLKSGFESVASLEVTRRELVFGARDSTTGWYEKKYQESTIEMIIIPRSSSRMALAAGTFVRAEYLGLAADPVKECDEIKTASDHYYEVEARRPIHTVGGDSISHYEYDLTHLPLHGLSYSVSSPSVADARYNTKNYWETYLNHGNLQYYSYIVCYDSPSYPFARLYKNKRIDIIFAVGQPNSTPLLGHTLKPHGYEEHVATFILTLDTQLNHLAETELRRITENYPEGSQRSLERRTPQGTFGHRDLGSTRLYETEVLMNYRRGTD